MRFITRSLALVSVVGFSIIGVTGTAIAGPDPDAKFVSRPIPADGDVVPFLPPRSATDANAPTVGVIGDSVARQFSFLFARHLGPRGIRVVDAAVPACPAGQLLLISGSGVRPRGGTCPDLVRRKYSALSDVYHPRVIILHSLIEVYSAVDGAKIFKTGSRQWEKRVYRAWNGALERLTAHGERILLILPVWYPRERDHNNTSLASVRALYLEWARRHKDKVKVVNVDRVVCPSGRPCDGRRSRPDGVHYSLRMGYRVVARVAAEPELARLSRVGGRP